MPSSTAISTSAIRRNPRCSRAANGKTRSASDWPAPEYADKYATVQVEITPSRCVYTVTDEGQGFDPRPYFEFEPGRATHAHGRGIAMARRLSFSSIEYLGNGNTVRATSPRAEHSAQHTWTPYEIANRSTGNS